MLVVCHWFTPTSTDEEVSLRSVTSSPVFRFLFTQTPIGTQNYVWSSYGFPCQILLLMNQQITTEGICEWYNGLFLLRSWKKLKRTQARAEARLTTIIVSLKKKIRIWLVLSSPYLLLKIMVFAGPELSILIEHQMLPANFVLHSGA